MPRAVADSTRYRSRAIFLFQRLDGVDVLLFVMYVQEYDSSAPAPNRGKLYIAYLDSVHYFRPRHHRTLVYHELLLAYLEYSRRKGYTSCYLWACPPPTKRDDYVIHCHPPTQRVPNPERLRKWYHDMIRRGVADGVVLSSCALFEEHFESSGKAKARAKSHKKQVRGCAAAVG
jgi:E1A/CREB-binding protein